IHEKGITPDIVVPMTIDEEEAMVLRRGPGGIEALDEERRKKVEGARDVQLERAMDVLRGISLYTKRNLAGERVASRKTEKVAAAVAK
ncbi:MAG TPA: carboxyl-terminal protease, partial [Verrucomicrobiae bacterium]|nr:carboxyl-terminal protease [Verrucomicrobiae bacterium]